MMVVLEMVKPARGRLGRLFPLHGDEYTPTIVEKDGVRALMNQLPQRARWCRPGFERKPLHGGHLVLAQRTKYQYGCRRQTGHPVEPSLRRHVLQIVQSHPHSRPSSRCLWCIVHPWSGGKGRHKVKPSALVGSWSASPQCGWNQGESPRVSWRLG